jgi:hypothetical protein
MVDETCSCISTCRRLASHEVGVLGARCRAKGETLRDVEVEDGVEKRAGLTSKHAARIRRDALAARASACGTHRERERQLIYAS